MRDYIRKDEKAMLPENGTRQGVISGYKQKHRKRPTKEPKADCTFGCASARAREAKQAAPSHTLVRGELAGKFQRQHAATC